MSATPTDVANLALLAIGSETFLGDIEDGTKEANVCLMAYRPALLAILRGAPWQFARTEMPLNLLADRTGNSPGYPTRTLARWIYEYSYPNDCVHFKYVPRNTGYQSVPSGNYAITQGVPISENLAYAPIGGGRQRISPAPFLVAVDPNYPPDPNTQWWRIQGQSPSGSTVICTDVKNALGVYTAIRPYPSQWDALFHDAVTSKIASDIVMSLTKDKQRGMAIRRDQIAIAKSKLMEARVADGNETWSSTDHVAEWITARNSGGEFGGSRGFDGFGGGGWSQVPFSDGSAY